MVALPASERDSVFAPASDREIGDYAIIGNCRAAALVSREGSIDWCCLPRFDSASVFGAILDPEHGGSFIIRPRGVATVTRSYVGATNVLRTEHRSSSGLLRVTDLMPVASETRKQQQLWPDHEILRIVECVQGSVDVELLCDPRPSYGARTPRLKPAGRFTWMFDDGSQPLLLVSELGALPLPDRPGLYGRRTLRAGERLTVSLAYSEDRPAILPVPGAAALDRLAQSLDWWNQWSGRCTYQGPHRGMVVRSALALKLMVYAPSGAIIAAPTTSLPERIGGPDNWDYRYCWLRDASFTLRALLELGYSEEASAFLSWLLHATRLTWPRLAVLYDVFGDSCQRETDLPLRGYKGSRPVRVGNAAHEQLQLDVYGAVIDAAFRFTRHGGRLGPLETSLLLGFGRSAAKLWTEADEGIWEPRSGRRHHTLSKAMCWISLDRLTRLQREGTLEAPLEWPRTLASIRADIVSQGFDSALNSYTAEYGEDRLDASLLLLALYGFEDPRSPRMLATTQRILSGLSAGGPLLYRYTREQDDTRAAEGAFGICSFWAVECLALQGRTQEAAARFDQLLTYAGELGLFAEEIDPGSGAHLGNFPQAFTHVGLINAAHTLLSARGEAPIRRAVSNPISTARP